MHRNRASFVIASANSITGQKRCASDYDFILRIPSGNRALSGEFDFLQFDPSEGKPICDFGALRAGVCETTWEQTLIDRSCDHNRDRKNSDRTIGCNV